MKFIRSFGLRFSIQSCLQNGFLPNDSTAQSAAFSVCAILMAGPVLKFSKTQAFLLREGHSQRGRSFSEIHAAVCLDSYSRELTCSTGPLHQTQTRRPLASPAPKRPRQAKRKLRRPHKARGQHKGLELDLGNLAA